MGLLHNKNQHYAQDESGKIVSIKDASKERIYYCPACGGEMITKRGDKNEWHYAHKHITPSCSYESYLHKIAKYRICKYFLNCNTFLIELPIKEKCSLICKCEWASGDCEQSSNVSFDLKQYYNCAKEEMKIHKGGFVADICLTKDNQTIDPIFIEINCTHPCDKAKIESGIRIIEIDIKSEKDIERILKTRILSTNDGVRFYNFKPKDIIKNLCGTQYISVFRIFESRKFLTKTFPCSEKEQRNTKTIFEISTHITEIPIGRWGLIMAYKTIGIKNCLICKYHVTKDNLSRSQVFCCLYKKLRKQNIQEYTEAASCEAFTIDTELLEFQDASFTHFPCKIWKMNRNSNGI